MSSVGDGEILYRRVLNESNAFAVDAAGKIRISSQAFTDRNRRPSVDRAALCNSDPTWTQEGPDHGVLRLKAGEVREIGLTKNDKNGNAQVTYAVDVHPDPTTIPRVNPAHAEIRAAPTIDSDNVFRRLQEALVKKAQWELLPARARQNQAQQSTPPASTTTPSSVQGNQQPVIPSPSPALTALQNEAATPPIASDTNPS